MKRIFLIVILLLLLLPLLLILLLAFMISGIVQSNQLNQLQNKPVCEYRIMEFEEESLNEMLMIAEEEIIDPYYAAAAVQIAAYEEEPIDEILPVMNELIEAAVESGFDQEGTMIIQAYQFGVDYIEWLSEEGLLHSQKNAKRYQQLMMEETEDKEYLYYKEVLMPFDENCHFFEGDYSVPIEAPFRITGDFMGDEYQSAIGKVHYGIDMSNDYGADLYAFTDAEVVSVYKKCPSDGGYLGNSCGTVLGSGYGNGNNVVLRAEIDGVDVYAIYAHCKNVYVSIGEEVAAGEIIASQGNSGNTSGSHLHFELRVNAMNFGDADVSNLINPHDLIEFE